MFKNKIFIFLAIPILFTMCTSADTAVLVESISINGGDIAIKQGRSAILNVTVLPDDADDKRIAWSSTNDQIATVNENGFVNAIALGSASIMAAAQDGSGITDSITVTVEEDPIMVTGITIETGDFTLEEGETRTLTAVVLPDNAGNRNITWSTSDAGVATVSPIGLVTAVAQGTVTITASAQDDSGITASITVTVNTSDPGYPVIPSWPFTRVVLINDQSRMFINNVQVTIDTENSAPVVRNSHLLVPFEAAKTALDRAGVTWNVTGDSIKATYNTVTAELTMSSTTMLAGGATTTLPAAPEMINDIEYIPLMSVAQVLNCASIGWDAESGTLIVVTGVTVSTAAVTYGNLNNRNEAWYGSGNSLEYADTLLVYQRNNGGWPRGTGQGDTGFPTILVLTPADRQTHLNNKNSNDTYFGRGITSNDIRYLITMYDATRIERYRESYMRGLNAVLDCQYPNGGFPYYLTDRSSYRGTISFNDDAMENIMWLLYDIKNGDFDSVDPQMLERCSIAFDKGLNGILDMQVYSEAQQMLTAWAQHYSSRSLVSNWATAYHPAGGPVEPTWAREFEPPSISGSESVPIIRFLMDLDKDQLSSALWIRVQNGIHGAVAFFTHVEIRGFTHSTVSGNRVLTANANSTTGLWPRFICIYTFEPLFSDRRSPTWQSGESHTRGVLFPSPGGTLRNRYRDAQNNSVWPTISSNGVITRLAGSTLDIIASYADLSHERRNGYQYIGTYGRDLPTHYQNWLTRNGLTAP